MATGPRRILELDALRGLAALAVVGFHYSTRYDQLFGHQQTVGWGVPLGSYGVELFFMLSGFVILMTLDRTKGAFSFAWGRFTRLYPAYWIAMALTLAVVALFGLPGQEVTLRDALLNVTMVPALLGAQQVDGAYWSLQAELLFYANMLLLWQAGLLRRPLLTVSGWLLLSAVAAIALSLAEQGYLPAAFSQVTKLLTLGSLKYIPLFGIGILLYAWRTDRVNAVDLAKGLAACLLVNSVHHGLLATAITSALAAVLTLAVTGWLPLLKWKPLVYLGALSYPLYLTHQNIGYVVIRETETMLGSTGAIALAAAVALSIAVLLHHRIEKPALAWLRSTSVGPLNLWPARLLGSR